MCGIALVVDTWQTEEKGALARDAIRAALSRRGPEDSGVCQLAYFPTSQTTKKVQSEKSTDVPLPGFQPLDGLPSLFSNNETNDLLSNSTTKDVLLDNRTKELPAVRIWMATARLALRGKGKVNLPLEDKDGNILLFNGEIFGGLPVANDKNDGEVLLEVLAASDDVAAVLSSLRGPWALLYFQSSSGVIWGGRDVTGRRSLLFHRPSPSAINSRTANTSSTSNDTNAKGADEQCGGYARYRTKFREGGEEALASEMRRDVMRLWQRNLGRDDRCISDSGKEARFPFLDEEVMEELLSLPLRTVVDLRLPPGEGDKLILRQVARRLGIEGAASLPKRAIQFGSRIARESNQREFGSNRAANQKSAGGLSLHL